MGDINYNRINYGISSICPFAISDGQPYGILKVLGGGTMTMSSEFEELFGGANRFAWAVEAKTISTEWTATVKSFPNFLFELFLGATVSSVAASALGTVDGLENINGTSIFDATTGIATATLKSGLEADLKDGQYLIVYASATTVDVYALSDLEFKKGVNVLSYVDDTLKIPSTLTVVTGAAVEIPNTGVELTGGSGTIAFVAGESAMFKVSSAHGGVDTIDIGSSGTIFPEHRQLCVGQKRANGDTFELEMYKVIGSGMPLPLEEQAFSVPELAMKLVYDAAEDKVASIRAKKGASA